MKRIFVLTLCFTFLVIGCVFAEAETKRWEVGFEGSHITYKEAGIMEEEGTMYGITGSYTFGNKLIVRVEGKCSLGEVDYISSSSGTIDDIDDYMLEFRGLLGYGFAVLEASTITPYIGAGYRYLNNDSSGMKSSTGALGYERESNYYYSPIGIMTNTELENDWSIGITLEYDYFWEGEQKSHLSDVNSGFNDFKNKQKKGYGYRASVKFQNKDKILIEPFIRYWKIRKSDETPVTYAGAIVGYGFEPKNTSMEFGIKFAAKF